MTNELEKKQFCSAHKLSLQETKTSKTICFKTTSNGFQKNFAKISQQFQKMSLDIWNKQNILRKKNFEKLKCNSMTSLGVCLPNIAN